MRARRLGQGLAKQGQLLAFGGSGNNRTSEISAVFATRVAGDFTRLAARERVRRGAELPKAMRRTRHQGKRLLFMHTSFLSKMLLRVNLNVRCTLNIQE
ncbi:hypothetical protein [Caballeronia sp.]|uniref:hypothetical protein n=1 Tax=Caballeronia sp. TaxID=1931223 RepID=UPI003C617E14